MSIDSITKQTKQKRNKAAGLGEPPAPTQTRDNIKQPETIAKGIDGRSLRSTGRTEQFNTRVTPGWKREVKIMCAQLEMTQGELLEYMLDLTKKFHPKSD